MTSLVLQEGGDLSLLDPIDVVRDDSIVSAVLVSLFCDARDDTQPAELRRGFWADQQDDRVGSLLWRLERAKATAETAAEAREVVSLALSWLVRDGIAQSVVVTAEYTRPDFLALDVLIVRGTAQAHSDLWRAFVDADWPWALGTLRIRGEV